MVKGVVVHLNKFEPPSPMNALCQVWLKFAPVVSEKKIFKFRQMNEFLLFHDYLPLEKGVVLHLSNLNPLNPRMLCAKFG